MTDAFHFGSLNSRLNAQKFEILDYRVVGGGAESTSAVQERYAPYIGTVKRMCTILDRIRYSDLVIRGVISRVSTEIVPNRERGVYPDESVSNSAQTWTPWRKIETWRGWMTRAEKMRS
jgi:hypothetical protein